MRLNEVSKDTRVYKWLFILLTVTGVVLRLYQYFYGRPIWEDEAHLALNFIDRGFDGLSKPLDNYQVAPILFLYGVETFTHILGFGDKALRALPFLISLCTFPLFYFVAYYISNNKLSAIISYAIFTFSAVIILYGAEVKPYIIELSAYIALAFVCLSSHKFVVRYRILLLAVLGSLFLIMANATHIILVSVTIYLLSTWTTKRISNGDTMNVAVDIYKKHLYVFFIWGSVFLWNYTTFIANHPYSEGMKDIWKNEFLVSRVFSAEFAQFMEKLFHQSFFRFDYAPYDFMLAFNDQFLFPYALIGLLSISVVYVVVKRHKNIFIFLLMPILLHFILSMEGVYPLYYRFYLYLLPAVIILISIGLTTIISLMNRILPKALAIIPIAYVLFCTIYPSVKLFPVKTRDIHPALTFINKYKSDTKLFITTPATLYQYNFKTYTVQNNNTENIAWGIQPEQYYEIVSKQSSPYLLLCSTNGVADGYGAIIEDINKKGLVKDKIEGGSYSVFYVEPISERNEQ